MYMVCVSIIFPSCALQSQNQVDPLSALLPSQSSTPSSAQMATPTMFTSSGGGHNMLNSSNMGGAGPSRTMATAGPSNPLIGLDQGGLPMTAPAGNWSHDFPPIRCIEECALNHT